jgi:hypothetical protein
MSNEVGIPGYDEATIKIAQIFQPRLIERTLSAIQGNLRFVHYTNADTATKILKSKEVWMRKSSCMNDFMEIEHGVECLHPAYKEQRERFRSIFDGMFPEFSSKFEELYNGWLSHFRTESYITCISEHDDQEDGLGRLSMWRAYGGNAGVAIVVKGKPFLTPSDALKANTHPVSYLDKQTFAAEFSAILDDVDQNVGALKELGENSVMSLVFDMFKSALLCTKHVGFHEEREWRVIYCPTYEKSEHIRTEIETIGGIPQPVCKIPLKDIPDESLIGIEVPSLIDRVIIGPCQYPWAARDAFIAILEQAGIAEAYNRVFISDIPLRQ